MFAGKKGTIGLDIGSRYLKMAQLNATRAEYELSLFSMLPLEKDIVADGLILNKPRLVSAIKSLLGQAGVKKADVVMGLSGQSSVISRVIKVPSITEEELSLNIKYEAEQYIPFDIKDVNIDFEILGSDREEPGMMNVMLVAAKSSVMNDYADVAEQAGLTPVIIDVDCFAVANMYEANYGSAGRGAVALVNIGACKTHISVIKNGQPVFTRDTAVGSNAHTDSIERTLNVSKEKAERIKLGEPSEGVSKEVVSGIVEKTSDEIYAEIYRSFEYYKSGSGDEEISRIIVSGGGALIGGFTSMMSERLGIPAETADVFRKIGLPDKLAAQVGSVAPIAAAAVGLAMRSAEDRQ
jgi:type IV pilus assembly protein PilM